MFVTRYIITDACNRVFTVSHNALRQQELRSILQHTEKSYQRAVNIADITLCDLFMFHYAV